jgi:hypothetical protein
MEERVLTANARTSTDASDVAETEISMALVRRAGSTREISTERSLTSRSESDQQHSQERDARADEVPSVWHLPIHAPAPADCAGHIHTAIRGVGASCVRVERQEPGEQGQHSECGEQQEIRAASVPPQEHQVAAAQLSQGRNDEEPEGLQRMHAIV